MKTPKKHAPSFNKEKENYNKISTPKKDELQKDRNVRAGGGRQETSRSDTGRRRA